MAQSYDPRQHPGGPVTQPQGTRSALRGPKRTGPIGAVVPGDDIEVARELARLRELIGRMKRVISGNSAQKIIEVNEVEIGDEPKLNFRDSLTVGFTGLNEEADSRDTIQAHALFVNPGDIAIDPDFAECIDVYGRAEALTLTSGSSVFGTIVDGSQFVVGTEAAQEAGFVLQFRFVGSLGSNMSNLIVYVNGSQGFVWSWDPGESPSDFDSGWVTPSQTLSGDSCDEVETQLTFLPHNTTFGSSVGPGILYSRWVYAPGDADIILNDLLPPGNADGQIIVWDNDLNLWEMTLATIANARHKLRVNGGITRSRQRYNLIAGPGISLSASDDSANEEVDVTIRASLSAGSGNAVGVAPPTAPGDILVAVGNSPSDPTAFKALQDSLGAYAAWDLQDGAAATTANDRAAGGRDWTSEIGNAFQGDAGPTGADESMRLAGNGFNRSAFGTLDDNFSFDTWVRITNAANAQNYLFSPGFSKWALYVDSSGVLGILVQGVGFFSSGGSNIEDSQDHHIGVKREGGEWFFYVDGELDGSVTSALTGAPSGTAALGQDTAGGNSPSGFMAYPAYYETPLLDQDFRDLFESMLDGPALSWQPLAAGSVGDVLTIGAGGLPEWA